MTMMERMRIEKRPGKAFRAAEAGGRLSRGVLLCGFGIFALLGNARAVEYDDVARVGWNRYELDKIRPINDRSNTPEIKARMEQSIARNIDYLMGVYAEVYKPGSITAKDEVTIYKKFPTPQPPGKEAPTETLIGKYIDFGTYSIVITTEKRHIIPFHQIVSVKRESDAWRDPAQRPGVDSAPKLPDLDVIYIERLPRYAGNHSNVGYAEDKIYLITPNSDPIEPAEGTEATFVGHVMNAGFVESGSFAYAWWIDGKQVESGMVEQPLKRREEAVVELKWPWRKAAQTVALKVQPVDAATREISTLNNTLEDPIHGKGFLIHIDKETVRFFCETPGAMDTYSFEDWVQHNWRAWNFLLMDSIYPSAPEGCLDRMRVDRIMYLDNRFLGGTDAGWDEYQKRAREGGPLIKYEGIWGYTGGEGSQLRTLGICAVTFHECGHQLGLIDWYKFFARPDHFPTCRDENNEPIILTHTFRQPETMMCWHDPHRRFYEVDAAALNMQVDRHRGHFGDYNFYMPKKTVITIKDRGGEPVKGARLSFRQRALAGEVFLAKPHATVKTDSKGRAVMPNQPVARPLDTGWFQLKDNPWGDYNVVGGNGLMLISVEGRDEVDHFIVDISFNTIPAYRGNLDTAEYEFLTHIPVKKAPTPPQWTKVAFKNPREVVVSFLPSASRGVTGYRLYRRLHSNDTESEPALLADIPAENGKKLYEQTVTLGPGGDRLYLSALDDQGRESARARMFLPYLGGATKIACNADGDVFVTNPSSGWGQIHHQDPSGIWKRFELMLGLADRTPVFGLDVRPDGRMAVTAPKIGRVQIYDSNGVPGESFEHETLKGATDIAVGPAGRHYVASPESACIAVFDAKGKFVAQLAKNEIEAGTPFGFCLITEGRGVICDTSRNRILVIDLDEGTVLKTISDLPAPQDAIQGKDGNLYLACGGVVKVLNSAWEPIREIKESNEGAMGNPTGIAFDKAGNLLCADPGQGIVTASVADR